MSVRATTTHIDKYGVTHRIDLILTGYGGSATELRGTSGFLRFTHENLSEADVFSTPIQRGRLDYGVWIDSTAQKAVIDELFASQEGQFLVQWYRDSVLFWTGTVALDLSNFDEGAYPYRAQITAKDLTYLEGLAFPTYADPTPANSFATRRTLISLIAECLPYSLNIVTATSWVESNTNTALDFLRQIYLDASSLNGLTRYAALERMLSANGLFLKQADGVWLIEQLSAHITPSSVTRWTYNSSGVYQSEATVDPRVLANTNLKVVTGSLSSVAPAYKSVSVRYDADLGESIEVPEEIDVRNQAQTFSQQYISSYDPLSQTPQQSDRIRLIATGVIRRFSPSANVAANFTRDCAIQIQAGNQYLWQSVESGFGNSWFTTSQDVVARAYLDSYDSRTQTATYKAQFNIESEPIPAPTSTTNYGRLSVTFLSSDINLQYENVKFELVQGEIPNVFQLAQSGQYSTSYQKTVNIGDGPRAYALTALRWQTGTGSLDKVTDEWQRRGSTAWRSHSVNLAKEVMDFQRTYARTLQVVARGAYSPSQTLQYDLVNWYYIGGAFDGFAGDWTMVFVRNAFATATDTLETTAILTPAQVGTGIVTAIASTSANSVEAVGQFLLRLALPATGTIAQIVVADIDQFVRVKAGQRLRLVHPITLQSDEVVVSSDRNSGAFIGVVSKTLSADYPIGSYVFVSASSVQAGILVGENAVRIFAEGQSLGRLTADVNGSVTSLPVNLYTRVLAGMDMKIVNALTGDVYAVTATGGPWGPGEVTMTIEQQLIAARTGDALTGDNSFQQSQITVTQGLIVLKVNSNGRVAQIRLGADDLGSEIDISAEQVKINGIVFTEGTDPSTDPGDVQTVGYVAGTSGWKIDGDGSAEFNDVTVRGEIEAQSGSIEGTLTMGALGEITNATSTYTFDANGLEFAVDASNDLNPVTARYLGFRFDTNNLAYVQGAYDTVSGRMTVVVGAVSDVEAGIEIVGDLALIANQLFVTQTYVRSLQKLEVFDTTQSTSKDTGALVVEGGVGIEKNLNVGGDVRTDGAIYANITEVDATDSPYTVASGDHYIIADASGGAITINLPSASTSAGRKIVVVDTGTSGSNNITIDAAGADVIDGAGTYVINRNYESVTLICAGGTSWYIVTKYH